MVILFGGRPKPRSTKSAFYLINILALKLIAVFFTDK